MTSYVQYGTEYLKRLREHRRRMRLALRYVAKAMDISVHDLECYESGKKPIPKEILAKLAHFYRVSPRYFLGGISLS